MVDVNGFVNVDVIELKLSYQIRRTATARGNAHLQKG